MSTQVRARWWLPLSLVALSVAACSSTTPRDQNFGSTVGRPRDASVIDSAQSDADSADTMNAADVVEDLASSDAIGADANGVDASDVDVSDVDVSDVDVSDVDVSDANESN
jgi:hypothetical protein